MLHAESLKTTRSKLYCSTLAGFIAHPATKEHKLVSKWTVNGFTNCHIDIFIENINVFRLRDGLYMSFTGQVGLFGSLLL